MDKKLAAGRLKEIAARLEIKGESGFKVNAFRSAARNLGAAPDSLDELLKEGRLSSIKGFGKSITATVEELAASDDALCEPLRQLRESVPDGLVDMLRIEGFGAKKAHAVWSELDITSIAELEYAAKENRLVALPGFGAKIQEKILKGIKLLAGYAGRHLASAAREAAAPLLERLSQLPEVERIELAGSLRRWAETVKDIDLVVASANPEAVMSSFVKAAAPDGILAQGPTKSAIRLHGAINVDLRVVDQKQFPFLLHHLTGSKEHNVAMHGRAQRMNLKLNEYGLFKEGAEEPEPCANEAELFRALDLDFIPPELREGLRELELAEQGQLPELVTEQDLKGLIHCHTTYSDGRQSVEQMALAARDLGYSYIAITDHSKSAAYAHGLDVGRIREQQREIDELNARELGIRILKGIESDIMPDGSLDYDAETLASFDLVIASAHSHFKLSAEEQTRRLVTALKNPHTHMLGHPTGRLLLGREAYPLALKEVLKAAAGEGKVVELNANPHRLDIAWRQLPAALELGVKISINPDAHEVAGMRDVVYGIGVARKGGCSARDVVNTYPCDDFLAAVRP